MLAHLRDIINSSFAEICNTAAEVGIDWTQHADSCAIPEINKKAKTINTKDKGSCGYIIRVDTNKHGQPFPSIIFRTFKNGGQSVTWSGIKALVSKQTADTVPYVNFHKTTIEDTNYLVKRAQSLDEFSKMQPCTTSAYLTAKGLDNYIELFKDTGKGSIAYPLTDLVTSEIVGYGWASNTSKAKGRSSGSGNCIAVSDNNTDSTESAVYVTEGMSDALTIAAATGCRAIAALGATNIHKAVEHLASLNKYQHIIIATDNDDTGRTVCKPDTAYEYTVVAPKQLKDFNQVYVRLGVGALMLELNNTIFARTNPTNSRYCDFSIVTGATNVVTAEKGTGKTTAIKKYINESNINSLLIISHRRTLSSKLATEFNCSNYEDVNTLSKDKSGLDREARLVISVEQLTYLDIKQADYEVVIIDECEQVISHAATSKTVENNKLASQYIVAICRKAKTVILSDANVMLGTKYLVNKLSVGSKAIAAKQVQYIANEYKPRAVRGDTITTLSTQAALLNSYSDMLKSGERVVYMSDSRKETEKAYQTACSLVSEDKVLLLNSKTMTDNAAILANINEEVHKYTTVIYSPALGTGFSIDEGHGFKIAFGMFLGQTATAETSSQMLARFRGLGNYVLFVGNRKGQSPVNYSEALQLYIHNPITQTDKIIRKQTLTIDDDGNIIVDTYSELRLNVECVKAVSRNDYREAFISVLKEEGFKIEEVEECTKEKLEEVEAADKAVKEEVEAAKEAKVSELRKSINKHVKDELASSVIAHAFVSGVYKKVLAANVLANATELQLMTLDTKLSDSYKSGKLAALELKHYSQKAQMFKEFSSLIGLSEGRSIELSSVDVSKFEVLAKSLYRVTLGKDNTKAAGKLLSLYGLKSKANRYRKDGDIVRDYYVDDDSLHVAEVINTNISKDLLDELCIELNDVELDVLGL